MPGVQGKEMAVTSKSLMLSTRTSRIAPVYRNARSSTSLQRNSGDAISVPEDLLLGGSGGSEGAVPPLAGLSVG